MANMHKINYFISYMFVNEHGSMGFGNTSFTLDKPIEDYYQIEELHKLIMDKNQNQAMKGVAILYYKKLLEMKL